MLLGVLTREPQMHQAQFGSCERCGGWFPRFWHERHSRRYCWNCWDIHRPEHGKCNNEALRILQKLEAPHEEYVLEDAAEDAVFEYIV